MVCGITARRKKAARRAGALLACFVFLCAFFSAAQHTFASAPEQRVLFISSYTLAFGSVPDQIEGIENALGQKAALDYLFMDTKTLRDEASQQLFYEVCKNKLEKSPRYAAVIVGDDAALNFALAYRAALFAGLPLIFEGVSDISRANLAARDEKTTGVMELAPYTENIQMAMQLFPAADKIIALTDDTENGLLDTEQFLEQAKLFPGLAFSTLSSADYTRDELCEKLAEIGQDTLVFCISMNIASDGTVYSSAQQGALLREYLRVPAFRVIDSGMGEGFLGGKMISFREMGRLAGEMAVRVLEGEDTRSIPVVLQTPTQYCYDYAVMQRFGLTKSDMNGHAVYVNDPAQGWERSRATLMGAALLLLAAAVAAVFILRDNRRHRETARALRTTTAHLAYTAHFDALTGVYRRAYFFERTQELLQGNPQKTYVIFRTDIQRFRLINDLYGSEMGDAVLVEFGRLLRGYVEEHGTCARFQADNFLGCVTKEHFDANALLQHLDSALRDIVPGHEIVVSLGLYEVDDINLPVALMCDRANIALQRIKGSVVNRCTWYDASLRNQMLEEQSLSGRMKDALLNGEFCVYYQPIYDLKTEQPVSAEALVRWQHPTRGLVSPGVFIPLFERNGFITKIDAFVCEQVCRLQRRRMDANKALVPISLNLSRVNFGGGRFADVILAIAERCNLPDGFLKLEVTESAYTDNPQQIMEEAETLRRVGFPILMDDFGSGYSSLNMLKDMPVDVLKLDMCFLHEFCESPRTQAIMRSVVDMARHLEMYVIAEGVETPEQVAFLRSIGCDAAQGFYFARPMPEDDFCALLEQTLGRTPHAPSDGARAVPATANCKEDKPV